MASTEITAANRAPQSTVFGDNLDLQVVGRQTGLRLGGGSQQPPRKREWRRVSKDYSSLGMVPGKSARYLEVPTVNDPYGLDVKAYVA